MRPSRLVPAVILSLLGGAPMGAREAHPRGPDTDKRPWVTRTFQIEGNHSRLYLTMSFPEPRPDGSFDGETAFGLKDGEKYNAWEPGRNPTIYLVRYPFTGHFWQGIFGDVGFHIELVKRSPYTEQELADRARARKVQVHPYPQGDADDLQWNALQQKPWDSKEDVLKLWQASVHMSNQDQRVSNAPEDRQLSDAPVIRTDFGTPCVQVLRTRSEGGPKDDRQYYFLFEPDYQIQLTIELVDNSDRPGLTKSDWRPRAEAIADKILQSVKVRVEPMVGADH